MAKILEKLANKFAGRRGSPRMPADEYLKKLESRGLGPDGRQVPDPDPMQPPIGYVKQPSMVEIIRQQVRDHLDAYARQEGHETFEESEDFEFEDEPEMKSGYENDTEPPLEELLSAGRQAIAEREQRAKSGGEGGPRPPSDSPEDGPEGRPPAKHKSPPQPMDE